MLQISCTMTFGPPKCYKHRNKLFQADFKILQCNECQNQGFWYFAEKKAKFRGIFGANSQKNRRISRDVRGKKSQSSRNNRPISRDFRRRKVKIRRKIGWFRGILAEKSQFSKDFQGQILRKIGRFHGKFRGGKLCQETISKKQPISLDIFWLNSINFPSIWPALVNVFLTRIIICSFNNSSLEKWANASEC